VVVFISDSANARRATPAGVCCAAAVTVPISTAALKLSVAPFWPVKFTNWIESPARRWLSAYSPSS
jgi:hypothetical protein